jgi:antitoxin MazE
MAEAAMQVSRWGNSLAVRLPKALVEQLGLKEGDELSAVAAKPGTIEVETREVQRRRALERMAARRPATFSLNRSDIGMGVSEVGNNVTVDKQSIDLVEFWAELDELGAKYFLPDGIPDEPPAEPDPTNDLTPS